MIDGIRALRRYARTHESEMRAVHDSSHTHNLLPGVVLALFNNKYDSFFSFDNKSEPQVRTQTEKDRIIPDRNYKQFWQFLPEELLNLFRGACKDIQSLVLANTKDFTTYGGNFVVLLSSSRYGNTEIPVHLHKTVLRPIVRQCLTVHVPLVTGTTENTFVAHDLIGVEDIQKNNLIHGDNLRERLLEDHRVFKAPLPSDSINIMYFSGAQHPHSVTYGNGLDLFVIFEDSLYERPPGVNYPDVISLRPPWNNS